MGFSGRFSLYKRLGQAAGPLRAVNIWLCRKLGIDRVFEVRIGHRKIYIRALTEDFAIAVSCLEVEFEMLGEVLPVNFDGLIIDAGGYIGAAAIRLSELYPSAKIVTIEPSPENFAVLQLNVAAYSTIHPINAALVSSENKMVKLFSRRAHDGFTVVERPKDNASPVSVAEVEAVRLQKICDKMGETRIGLCKLDIEGGEKALFQDEVSGLRDVDHIFVELHDRIVPGCSEAFETFSVDRQIKNFGGEKFLSSRNNAQAVLPQEL